MAAPAVEGPPTAAVDLIATSPGDETATASAALKAQVPETLKTESPGDETATTPAIGKLLADAPSKDPEEAVPPGNVPGDSNQDYHDHPSSNPADNNVGSTVGTDAVVTTMVTNPGIATTKKTVIHNKPVPTSGTVTDKSTAASDSGFTVTTFSPVHDITTKANSIQKTTPLPIAILHTTPVTLVPDAGTPGTTFFKSTPELGPTAVLHGDTDDNSTDVVPVDTQNLSGSLLESLKAASDSWSKLDLSDDGFLTSDWRDALNTTVSALYNVFHFKKELREWLSWHDKFNNTVSFVFLCYLKPKWLHNENPINA